MDIYGPEFAALMDKDLSASGLQALRDAVLCMAEDSQAATLLDWLITGIEQGPRTSRPEAQLSPVDTHYVDALVTALERRSPERIQVLSRQFDYLAFTRSERRWSPFKLLNFFFRAKMEPAKGTAIVTSVRNEGVNLLEWIAHHRCLGFDDFFFYVNDSDDGTEELLRAFAELGLCHVVINETRLGREGESAFPIQSKAYEHAIHFHNSLRQFRWVLFSDVDEFLFIKPVFDEPACPRPLDDLVGKLDGDPSGPVGVLFNWKWFISNAAYRREKGLVFDRFHSFRGSDHFKSFARLSRCTTFATSHLPHVVAGNTFLDDALNPIAELRLNRTPTYAYGQINHYWNKSFEEFALKKLRGRDFRSFDQFFTFGNNRSFGRVEHVPEAWIRRVKEELTSLRCLPKLNELQQLAEAKFRREIDGHDAERNLPALYIENRFPRAGADEDVQPIEVRDPGLIHDRLAPAGIGKPIPLVRGTERFAPPWVQYWHGSDKGEPWPEIVCRSMMGALVANPDVIWLADRSFDVASGRWVEPAIQPKIEATERPIRQIRWPCVVLPGKSSSGYGAGVLGQIFRIWVARDAAEKMRLPFRVLVDQPAPDWLPRLLEGAAGVPSKDIEFYSPAEERVLLWHALLPMSPLGSRGLNPMVNDFVERILDLQKPPVEGQQIKRIFLTQRSRRSPSEPECQNEADLVDLAVRHHGFTPLAIESVNFVKQATLFRGADIVLSNTLPVPQSLVFCKTSARVGSLGAWSLALSELGTLRGFQNAYFTLGIESRSRYTIDPSDFGQFLAALCC
ncbi:glycosyltransferase family 2 protein [Acidisoma sp. 7E03]